MSSVHAITSPAMVREIRATRNEDKARPVTQADNSDSFQADPRDPDGHKKNPGVYVSSSYSNESDPDRKIGHFDFYFKGSEAKSFPGLRKMAAVLFPAREFFRPDVITWHAQHNAKKPRVQLQFLPTKNYDAPDGEYQLLASKYGEARLNPDRALYLDVSPDLIRRNALAGNGKAQRGEAAQMLELNRDLKAALGNYPASFADVTHGTLSDNIEQAEQIMRDTKPVYQGGVKGKIRRKSVGLRRLMGGTQVTRFLRKKLISPLLREKRDARALPLQ